MGAAAGSGGIALVVEMDVVAAGTFERPEIGTDEHHHGAEPDEDRRQELDAAIGAWAATRSEVFLTGTASELVPVRQVDGRTIGAGRPGPITGQLLTAFHDLVRRG